MSHKESVQNFYMLLYSAHILLSACPCTAFDEMTLGLQQLMLYDLVYPASYISYPYSYIFLSVMFRFLFSSLFTLKNH